MFEKFDHHCPLIWITVAVPDMSLVGIALARTGSATFKVMDCGLTDARVDVVERDGVVLNDNANFAAEYTGQRLCLCLKVMCPQQLGVGA